MQFRQLRLVCMQHGMSSRLRGYCPKGATGATGATGPTGPTGPTGCQEEDGKSLDSELFAAESSEPSTYDENENLRMDKKIFDKGECAELLSDMSFNIKKGGLYQLAYNASGSNRCPNAKCGIGVTVNDKAVAGGKAYFDGNEENSGISHTFVVRFKSGDLLRLVNLKKDSTLEATMTLLRIADCDE